MSVELIELQEADLPIVKDIYDYYIKNSTATFHTGSITLQELKEIIPLNHPKYKSFLIKHEGAICGYCYISSFKKRQAYDKTAEFTIYLKPEFIGKNIGMPAMEKLEEVAKDNGIRVLIGVITGNNFSSIRLMEKCGYEKCAHYQQVGEKFDQVLDVVSYQKILY